MHAYSHIIRWVAAMDNCFALTGAHHHGIIIRSMNGANLCLKDPLLPGQLLWVQLRKQKKHTYTNPRPGQYLMHVHAYSHIMHAVVAIDSCSTIGSKNRENPCVLLRWVAQSIPLSTSSTQQDPGTAVFPPHTGKSDHGLVYACPLLYVCLMKMVN